MAKSLTRERLALILLMLLALALRLWGTGYALGFPKARPDEDRWVRVGLGLLENPNPHWFQWPTLHAYLLAAVYAAWGGFRLWRGDFPSWHAYLNEPQEIEVADLVLLGRYLSAAIGALGVPLVYRLGERTGPRGAGLLAALFLAVSFGPVRDAHWALIEPLLLLLTLAGLLLVARALDRPTLVRFALAGLVAGLATSAKYNGASLAAPIALAVALARRREGRSVLGSVLDGRGLASAAAMAAGFLAGSPYVLVARREFLAAMEIRAWSYADDSLPAPIGFVHHLVFSMRYSHGLLLELAGLAGLAWLAGRSPARLAVAGYAVATYLAIGPASLVAMRYASNLAPCVALGAAWLLLEAGRPSLRRPLVAALAALAMCAEPLYRDARFGALLGAEDTRLVARRWLDLNAEPGAAVLAPDSKRERWGRPVLEDRYRLRPYSEEALAEDGADWALLPESESGYAPFRPEAHAALARAGRLAIRIDPFAPGSRPVYDPHDAFFVPVAGFSGVSRPGPRISIYQLRPRPSPPAR